MKKIAFILPLLISACTLPDWLGASEDAPLKGDRYAVMSATTSLKADEAGGLDEVTLPAQTANAETPYNGNLYLPGSLTKLSEVSVGTAPEDSFIIKSEPVAAGNLILTIDGSNTITATDSKTLEPKWQHQLEAPEDKEDLPGGGVAVNQGIIYITTGFGDVVAANLADGTEIWRKSLNTPIRNAAVVSGDKLFIGTGDSRTFALEAQTGDSVWQHSGVQETTSVFGSSTPAIKSGLLVATYSSGEIFGINTDQGKELWTELISIAGDRTKVASSMTDIVASPVIADGIVYITSYNGNLSAFNLANGFRIWEQQIGSGSTPWVADKYLFIISVKGEVAAVNRFDGRIKWVTKLEDRIDKKNIVWSGPVIAGDKLVAVGSHGKLVSIDPKTGSITSKTEVPEKIFTAPVVANGSVFLLSNDGMLIKAE